MIPARPHIARSYIVRETGISIAINATLTLAAFCALFGLPQRVPVWGLGHYVFDFLPQGFMIALMATLVPGALARRARRAGSVLPLDTPARGPVPAGLWARALLMAPCGALAGTAIFALALWLIGPESLPLAVAIAAKLVWAALLAAVVTPIGLKRELARHTLF